MLYERADIIFNKDPKWIKSSIDIVQDQTDKIEVSGEGVSEHLASGDTVRDILVEGSVFLERVNESPVAFGNELKIGSFRKILDIVDTSTFSLS